MAGADYHDIDISFKEWEAEGLEYTPAHLLAEEDEDEVIRRDSKYGAERFNTHFLDTKQGYDIGSGGNYKGKKDDLVSVMGNLSMGFLGIVEKILSRILGLLKKWASRVQGKHAYTGNRHCLISAFKVKGSASPNELFISANSILLASISAKENANKVADTFGKLEDLDFGAFQSSDLVMKVEVSFVPNSSSHSPLSRWCLSLVSLTKASPPDHLNNRSSSSPTNVRGLARPLHLSEEETWPITTFLAVYIFTDTQNDEDYCTAGSKAEEKKAEKTAFDVNLEKFDTAAKIKQGVTKEEANDMIEKRKAARGVAITE
ncbi:hypothetical protein FEM48_Zijuj08G0160600 [Ziziphus jujuba var. spinosa]|uniref:Uncharacterized protein n=1 Tax=Ziziphus jujuba var. spinosa TaxID=714518 RepID=A0A978V018_ZIZJJ|nr:hypothetical protein FEM48_Zijuj08G0160600 [Ziziphus jujuba var. spinosa]